MLEIDAFNICLRSAGLRRISTIDLDDQQTADLDEIINQQKRQIQIDGWPFNMDRLDLVPVGGVIDVSGFLRVELPFGLSVLDGKVYDPRNRVFWDEALNEIWVVNDRQFSDLPELFQEWLARRSATRFVNSISGPDDTWQAAQLRETEAFVLFNGSDDAHWDPQVLWERRARTNPISGAIDGPAFGRRRF